MKTRKIVLIGAGNVAHHLGQHLAENGLEVVQVFSRKISKAKRLARKMGSEGVNQLSVLSKEADLYILAVSDRAIGEVAAQLSPEILQKKLIVHTSGATPTTVLRPFCKRYGIFYPLQTFSIGRKVDFKAIPICIHANRKGDRLSLKQLGEQLACPVYSIDDRQRAILHLAAVFVNNFTNHLFQIGAQITKGEQIPFELLLPLIQETAAKVQEHSPAEMQTGPAIRGDKNTLQRHLDYLQPYPELAALYRQLSKSIQPKLSL